MTLQPEIKTGVAWAGFDEHRFMGHKVFAELMGQSRLAELVSLAINGPKLSAEDLAIVEDLSVVLTAADPRIWPLKVTRLGACYGNGLTGMATAMLVMDNLFASTWHICPKIALQFLELRRQVERQGELQEMSNKRLFAEVHKITQEALNRGERIIGFGVPARSSDERTLALSERVIFYKRENRPYWRLFLALQAAVKQERNLPANITTAWTAQALDLGFTPEQIGPLSIGLGVHVFLANAYEAQNHCNASMQCLPAEFIDYTGPKARISPRAKAANMNKA